MFEDTSQYSYDKLMKRNKNNLLSLYLFRPKQLKAIQFGAAYTYIAHIMDYPLPPAPARHHPHLGSRADEHLRKFPRCIRRCTRNKCLGSVLVDVLLVRLPYRFELL